MAIFSGSSRNPKPPETATRRGDSPALTIVSSGTTIVGDLETSGVVKVEGRIRGTVKAARQILVSKDGVVEGDLFTAEAVIGGEVHGTIQGQDRVEVQATAVIHGDIVTQRILILEGGQVNGAVSMTETLVPQPLTTTPEELLDSRLTPR